MSTTDTTPHDDTARDTPLADTRLADEVLADTPPDTRPGTTPGPTAPGPAAPTDGPWLSGPAPFAIVLGLLGLVVAGAVLFTELTDVTFPWADLGPWTVVAAGLVVVLVGTIGLRSSRRAQA